MHPSRPKSGVPLAAALCWPDEKMVHQERRTRTEFSCLLRGSIEKCLRLEWAFALLRAAEISLGQALRSLWVDQIDASALKGPGNRFLQKTLNSDQIEICRSPSRHPKIVDDQPILGKNNSRRRCSRASLTLSDSIIGVNTVSIKQHSSQS